MTNTQATTPELGEQPDNATLARFLEALACDCDSTDSWESAATDLRLAASRLSRPVGDEPEAVQKLRRIGQATSGGDRMFTLEDGLEIVAYIDRLSRPSAVGDDVERDIRVAIWNAGMNGGMGQGLTQAFIAWAKARHL